MPLHGKTLSVYKEMEVSYRELASALIRLGYRSVADGKYFRFINEEFDSVILLQLPRKSDEEKVNKANFVALSLNMEWKGVIEDMDDLAKMIERDRETAQAIPV